MMISLLAALDEKNGIGRDGGMPWHLTDDLKHFRRLTRGHHVLMGRKTYATVAGKLPGRHMLVLSRDAAFQPDDAQVFADFQAAAEAARAAGEQELFVIGGAQVFALALPLAQRFYLTRVHADADCDVFFPPFDLNEWRELSSQPFAAGGKNEHAFAIHMLERK
ncbi:MAG TPA: dihydrofolate reductase [Anaerolineales bacterium]|nr:dihydrofolate reductase [Anaerolineales bacterium]HRQ92411.1 dihydrofolate reductase [Anaerolineales bacterium]